MAKMVAFSRKFVPPEKNENWTPELSSALVGVFREHFPDLEIGLEEHAYDLYFWAVEMPWPAWKHDDVYRQLDQIEQALHTLSRIGDLPWPIAFEVKNDALFRSRGVDTDLRNANVPPGLALRLLPKLHQLLAPSLEPARELVNAGYEGKTNWHAANAVHASRLSWKRCTGNDAQISLDEAGPFGRFVFDVFEALGISNSPRAAVDAWREVQRKRENS